MKPKIKSLAICIANPASMAGDIEKIKALHSDLLGLGRTSVTKAMAAGELLEKIKKTLNHGDWLPWCKNNLPDISERTVQNYLKIWKHRDVIKNASDADLALNYSEALASLSRKPPKVQQTASSERHVESEEEKKQEVMAKLQDAFIEGLETEDTTVIEFLLHYLPEWRPLLIEGARRETQAAHDNPCHPESQISISI